MPLWEFWPIGPSIGPRFGTLLITSRFPTTVLRFHIAMMTLRSDGQDGKLWLFDGRLVESAFGEGGGGKGGGRGVGNGVGFTLVNQQE